MVRRPLIPKSSNRYKVRVLTPHSFTVEIIQKPTKRFPHNPTRSAALEEANIESVVDELMAPIDKRAKILEWAQQAEISLAKRDQRSPRMIDVREAALILCHRLLEDDPSAISLLQRLGGPRKYSVIDAWRAAAYPPSNPTHEEKAYLDTIERREARRKSRVREWPRLLLEHARKKAKQAEASCIKSDRLKLLRQARVLEDMSVCLGEFFEEEEEQRAPLNKSQDTTGKRVHKYGMMIMRAVRNGLQNHPAVKVFIRGQVLTANRALLRRAKCGLETRVKTYKHSHDAELDIEIASQYLKGRSLRQIARMVKDKRLLLPTQSFSHTAISKRLKRLQEELPWFKVTVPICRSASPHKL
jgi:hypothetical protein